MKKIIILCLLALATQTCLAQQPKERRNDIKWVTQSIEYAALCEQTYRAAWQVVKEAAQSQTQNWVVALDVDETVLDNSQYAVERAAVDSGFTRASWTNWVQRKEATLVPGAKEFIDKVRTLGPEAHVAYITNRMHYNEAATIANLQKQGLFQAGDTILTRKNREDTKVMRRECLQKGTGRCEKNGPLVILALFGDNIRDFMPMRGSAKAKEYRDKKLPGDENWGVRYFMLPNPTYGSWERDYK